MLNRVPRLVKQSRRLFSTINSDVKKEKVITLDLKPGEKVAICRCWKSAKFPFCDGAHQKLNAAGDNVGPALVQAPKAAN
jgi:CDGSH-type Zn-finger protein